MENRSNPHFKAISDGYIFTAWHRNDEELCVDITRESTGAHVTQEWLPGDSESRFFFDQFVPAWVLLNARPEPKGKLCDNCDKTLLISYEAHGNANVSYKDTLNVWLGGGYDDLIDDTLPSTICADCARKLVDAFPRLLKDYPRHGLLATEEQ